MANCVTFSLWSDTIALKSEGRAASDRPLFSIIIPTFNSATMPKNLSATLSSIVKQTYCRWEIIVVDGFSTDGTHELVRAFPTRFFQVSGPIAVANNFGIRQAKGQYLLFLDSDQELPRTFLEECVDQIRSRKVDCIGYRQIIKDPLGGISRCNRFHNFERFLGAEPSDGIYCYSRSVVSGASFPEELTVMEDYYFRAQILRKHPRIGYVRGIVFHHRPQSARWLILRAIQYGRVTRRMSGQRLPKGMLRNYFSLTKRNAETRIDVQIGLLPPLLFIPFLLLKYIAFTFGFLLEQVGTLMGPRVT